MDNDLRFLVLLLIAIVVVAIVVGNTSYNSGVDKGYCNAIGYSESVSMPDYFVCYNVDRQNAVVIPR